jgi:hypothetical protein
MKGPDLTATVGQELVASNRTLHHLVDVVRRFRRSLRPDYI